MSALLAVALWLGGAWQPVELRLLDWQFASLRMLAPKPAGSDVVVVGIDEATTEHLREPLGLWHAHLGNFLQAAAAGGATAIGLDLVLPDRSHDQVLPGGDRALLGGIVLARRVAPVVLAVTIDPSGQARPVLPVFRAAAGPGAMGYALFPVDKDGKVRRFDEGLDHHGDPVPTLAGQMARRLGKPVASGWIDYAAGEPMRYLPLQDVLEWWSKGNTAALRAALGDRPVLLGSVLQYEDRHRAPVNLAGWDTYATNLPGVLVHAQALRNLLGGGLVRGAPPALVVGLLVLAALAWALPLGPAQALVVAVALAVFGLAGAMLLLHRGIYLPLATAWLLATAGLAGRQLTTTVQQLRERVRLRTVFGGYVSPSVMRQILDGRLRPTLGGERRYCCVMFSDIRGFTTRSERASPEQTISFLNRYFDRVVPVIHAHGGTVVSFMGDGIMAVFGAPNALSNPCESAYTASVAMLAQVRAANVDLEAHGEESIRIGIGLHAGEGVSGHVGSAARHEYSVIGDVTNVASRLEGLTKEVGYQLVCSDVVARQLSHCSDLVPLGLHSVKGRAAVEIFGAEAVQGG